MVHITGNIIGQLLSGRHRFEHSMYAISFTVLSTYLVGTVIILSL